MQAFDVKDKQSKRDERFRSSLFQENYEVSMNNSQPPRLSNQNYVQIFVKSLITQDVIATKTFIKQNILDMQDEEYETIIDDVIENESLSMKKEFNVFVERDLVSKIKLLSQNYIEKQDLIKMPVCGASGIRLPDDNDFALYFQYVKLKGEPTKQTILVQEQELRSKFGLLMCGCIFNDEEAQDIAFNSIVKNCSIEIIFKILLITVQYESRKFSPVAYKTIKALLLWQAGVLHDTSDPLLNQIIQNKGNVTFEVQKPNLIKIKTKEHLITINTTFLYPVYKQQEMEKNLYMKPLEQYTYFQVVRNSDITDEMDVNEFPHVYQLKLEANQQTYLICVQQESHGEMLIFKKLADKYSKYTDNYVGSIKRNLMGTSFKIADDGFSKKYEQYFPDWIATVRKNTINIEYETNILASQPRKFDISYLNCETKQFEQLITLAPKYNPDRDCYQLHFYGRAKIPSARNFQMIKPGDEVTVYLLHGKVDRSMFNLDFRPPLNPLQAFCISLVSISSKFLVS